MKGQTELTHFQERQNLIEWASKIQRLARTRSDAISADAIQHEIEELQSGRFMLAVLGKVKRGKSTFCNAYLGRQNDLVAPVDKLPSSSVISKFIWSEREEVTVAFRNGQVETTDYKHIADFVTEERNRENVKEVASVEVRGPFASLEKDLILVDTPGAGSIHKHHDALLHGFLPEADAAIFLVTARMPIAEDELELLCALKAHDIKKIFFAINQKDLVDDGKMTEDELQDAVQHNIAMLAKAGVNVDKIYRISAKRAMLGRLPDSGIPELLADISEFLATNKLRILHSQFKANVLQTAEALACNMAIEIDSAKKSKTELENDLAQLQESRSKIEQERTRIEARFRFTWDSAVERFEHGIKDAEEASKLRVQKEIQQRFPLLGAKQFIKQAPTLIAEIVDEETSEPGKAFEQAAKEAADQLQLEYPNLSIGRAGDVVIRMSGQSNTLIKGAAGGALTVATGFGLLSAASSAAVVVSTTALAPWVAGLASLTGTLTGAVTGILTSLGVGTVTSTATIIPAWAMFAGPVGWALVGVGALVVPFAYRASNLKIRQQLEDAALEHIKKTFAFIKGERVSQLKKTGARVLEQYQLKLQNDLTQIESAIRGGLERKKSGKNIHDIEQLANQFRALVGESQPSSCGSVPSIKV